MTETAAITRQPFDVRLTDRGADIWSGPTDNDIVFGTVYDKGPGSYDHEEMAKVWAAAYPVMFPALAGIRNTARMAVAASAPNALEILADIAEKASAALPVPTIGDLMNGTTPAALSAAPATSGRFATPDHVVAEVWRHLPKTPAMWEVVEPLSPPPLWLYEAMDKALTLLSAALPAAPSPAPQEELTDASAAECRRILEEMTALFEMDDEANEPGTDSYTVLWQAREFLKGATPAAGEALTEAPILWCVHHRGPDDLHPVENYEAAVTLADHMNEIAERFNFGKPRDDIGYVMSISYPAIWPSTAEAHAECLEAERQMAAARKEG